MAFSSYFDTRVSGKHQEKRLPYKLQVLGIVMEPAARSDAMKFIIHTDYSYTKISKASLLPKPHMNWVGSGWSLSTGLWTINALYYTHLESGIVNHHHSNTSDIEVQSICRVTNLLSSP